MKRLTFVAGLIALVVLTLAPFAGAQSGSPPDLITYQARVTDAIDGVLNGARDARFLFYDAAENGNLLLIDVHEGAQVATISNSLLTVLLGNGTLTPGTETTLDGVFRNRPAVYLETQLRNNSGSYEALLPRIRLVASGYALNSKALSGRAAESFLDTSSSAQIKAGDLTVSGVLSGNGGGLTLLNASNLTTGTVPEDRMPASVSRLGPDINLDSNETTGILPLAKGGTGASALSAGSLVFSDGTRLAQDNAALHWDNTNLRLGIGTSTPLQPLDVLSTTGVNDQFGVLRVRSTVDRAILQVESADGIASTVPLFRVEVDNLADKAIMVRRAGETTGRFMVDGIGATTWGPGGSAARDTRLFRSAANVLTLDNTTGGSASLAVTGAASFAVLSGNVGIGTAAPAQKLSVAGTIQSTAGGFMFPDGTVLATAPPPALWTPAGDAISNANAGNVGIGVAAPASKLAVAGMVESMAGGFKFPDGTTQATAATALGGAAPAFSRVIKSDADWTLPPSTFTAIPGLTLTIQGRAGKPIIFGFRGVMAKAEQDDTFWQLDLEVNGTRLGTIQGQASSVLFEGGRRQLPCENAAFSATYVPTADGELTVKVVGRNSPTYYYLYYLTSGSLPAELWALSF
jgi:hypothetical protein